jgi:uncharacterized protein
MLAINVAGLLRETPGTTRLYPVAGLGLDLGPEARLAEPLSGDLRLTRTNRGLIVDGRLATALAERCGRCLAPVVASVHIELAEEALPSTDLITGRLLDASVEPDALRIDEQHVLDLEPVVRDAISLAEPMNVLCREGCAGLCSACGHDRNVQPHDHEPEPDPRLAPLAGLLAQREE